MSGTKDRRVLWITGGGSGIGQATALRASRNGWAVAITGRREDRLENTATQLRAAGGDVLVAAADVGEMTSLRGAFDAVSEWGQIGSIVLAAGLNSPRRTWADQDLADFTTIVNTNLVATSATITLALPQLRAARGCVVVVSSRSAWRFSAAAGIAYSASKVALGSLCETLNELEGASGVRACHLCPGDVDSEFLGLRPTVPDTVARSNMLRPDDVAAAIQFVVDAPNHVRIDELVISPS